MEIKELETIRLKFDPENPRFFSLATGLAEEDIVSEMIEDEGVTELMLSIGSQDYFAGEPVLVMLDNSNDYIVLEGNRRLTAVKLLNGELKAPLRNIRSIERIIEESQYKPTELPCVVCEDREQVTRYLGFRHIRGVKEWEPLSKAIYVDRLLDKLGEGQTYSAKLKVVANEIGSNAAYLSRLMAALELYNISSKRDFFELNIKSRDIEFSLITTALSYSDITTWLGLDDLKENIQEQVDLDNLRLLFLFLFVIRSDSTSIVRESRELQELSHIVVKEPALALLVKTGDIEAAHMLTDGPSNALTNYLQKALKFLSVIWDELGAGTIDDLTANQIDLADQIKSKAANISNHVKNLGREE